MTEQSERADVGLARVLQVRGESVTYHHRAAGTNETVTVAFVSDGQGGETGDAEALVDTDSLSTAAVEGDEIVRSGVTWFVESYQPVNGTVQVLGLVTHQPQ